MAWLFNEPATHVNSLGTWWRFLTSNLPDGGQLHLDDRRTSAAMWYPPAEPGAGREPNLDNGGSATESAELDPFTMMVATLVGSRWREVAELFATVREAHPRDVHWYLAAVGTTPEAQGQGRGRELLRPVLDRCDAEGLPVYLESSNPRNLAFYHRLGFEIVGEIATQDRAACLTGMWRSVP